MQETHTVEKHERKVTAVERFLALSPYSIVTMVARIRGNVTENMLTSALSRVRLRHPNLRVRIVVDDDGNPWFTSEGAGEIQVEVVPREAEDDWIGVVQKSCQIPFEFDTRPAIRFVLIQSPARCELVILCHHILCDGLSLAYLARDLMEHLGDPDREVEVLPDPVPIGRDNMPEDVSLNAVARLFVNRINKKWEPERVLFDQEDYRDLVQAYWSHYQHQVLTEELSEAQTRALVERCRKETVTVNSALAAAFVGAPAVVQGAKSYHSRIAVGASLRDRLPKPAGEVMGFYAGAVTPKWKYDGNRGFWENARRFHQKVRPLYTNKALFHEALTWSHLDPSILEAINFKTLGGLVPEGSARYQKISAFSSREDTVLAILKRDKMESLDRITMGTAVTNLTRMDFPAEYGALELDRLVMKPGGAFPLVTFNLVLGAVTCAGKLSLLVEFVEDNIDAATMQKIIDKALGFLLSE
jgi:hypothetical protein